MEPFDEPPVELKEALQTMEVFYEEFLILTHGASLMKCPGKIIVKNNDVDCPLLFRGHTNRTYLETLLA